MLPTHRGGGLAFSFSDHSRRILSGSPSFRERPPNMAEPRRFDGAAVAVQKAAFAIRVVDLLGDSWVRIKKTPQNARHAILRGPHSKWLFDSFYCRSSINSLTKFHRTSGFVCDLP